MKFEYQQDSLVLKVLDTSHTGEVLDFYKRNKDSFEKYETDKPSNFYTYTFIYNLLKAEYNACIHGKHIRFFLYDNSVSDKIIGSVSFTDIKSSMKSWPAFPPGGDAARRNGPVHLRCLPQRQEICYHQGGKEVLPCYRKI